MTTRYWIGVASRDHVEAAENGGFCQFCHGRDAPVHQLSEDDGIVYYSPREHMKDGAPLRAFTAIGRVGRAKPIVRTNLEASTPGAAMSTIGRHGKRRSSLCSASFPSRAETRTGDG